jgi:hypothetical protein
MKHLKLFCVIFILPLFGEIQPLTMAQTSAPNPAPSATTGRYQPTTIPPIPDSVYNKLSPDDQAEADEYQQVMDAQNKNSINVYGKVVDQNGLPLAGVKVHGAVQISLSPVSERAEMHETQTDGQGLFTFTGLHGTRFGLGLEKIGYEYNTKLYTTWWNDYKPDPAHPMVFVMYKLQGAEPMVHAKIHDYIPCDGTEINYDLQTGKRVATGGDLIVKFTRNPVQIHIGKPFEWILVMTVPGTGGLIEINDSYPYEAPADGYQKTITITTGPNPSQYLGSLSKTYYYKSSDNKYGRIIIELEADFQPPPASLDGSIFLNPSGSRNLEWDETKQVKPQ